MISIELNIIILIVLVVIILLGILFWFFYKKYTKLRKLAYSDDLGIFNHREINRTINKLLKETSVKSFSFILIDIDRFKNYNDHYGYDKADLILQDFVNVTKSFIRNNDVFFRYKNGDEFVLIMQNAKIEQAKEIGNRLRRVIAYHPFKIENVEVNLTISMGITCNFKSDTPDKIRKRAEEALHEAKQSKNTIVLIDE